jgi:phytoene dehydrogenase-like protein
MAVNMEKSKIIIIGAGISGLSAGCYLQMNGYETKIFELHNVPGGLCTAWKRKEYTFDGCIHSLGGLNPDFKLYHWWNELIDMEKLKFFYYDVLGTIEDENGKTVTIYTHPDKLKKELTSIAPEDKKFISKFIKTIKKLSKYDTQLSKPLELWTTLDYFLSQFKTAPYLIDLIRWRKSPEEISKKCKSSLLKKIITSDFFTHYPAYFLIFSLAHLHKKNAGYPIGGSLPFSRLLEEKYLSLGGNIHYNSKVNKINVEDNRVVGVTLVNGEEYNGADIVVSAADGFSTIFKMLEGKYINDKLKKFYQNHPKWPSMVLVSLGISRTFENEPSSIELHLNKELVVDEESSLKSIPITIYNFDPTLAPKGKTCIRTILRTNNFKYWNNLRETNIGKYKKEKERLSKEIIRILDKHFGDIAKNLEVIDVATPSTFYRYTNNWRGSTQGWEWLPGLIPETLKKELPGLYNFYMIGQWTMPGGGVSTAFQSGRDIARIICEKEKKKFRTC